MSFWQLLAALRQAGHRIRVIAPMTAETAEEARQFDASLEGIETYRYVLPRYATDPSRTLGETYSVERTEIPALMDLCIAARTPDVILVGRDTQTLPVAPTARRHGIPWVLRSTGYLLRTIEEGCHDKAQSDPMLGAAQDAEKIVVQAAHMLPLAERLGYRRMVVIPNAVDEHRFVPQPASERMRAKLEIAPEAPIVAHISNLKPVKRVVDVIDSAPAVLARYPQAIYVVAGDGAERPALEKRCGGLGIAANVRFPGWLPYPEVAELLSIATAVVMPSDFEQQAGVYIETQACGRTLLASDIPGAREVVEDGRTGLLFRVADPADLACKTLLALGDSTLRGSIGAHAATEVLKRHSLEKVAAQFESILRGAVAAYRNRLAGAVNASPTAL